MSVFISVEGSPEAVVIRIDGWLENDDSNEVMKQVEAISDCVAVDIARLDSADAAGLNVLTELRNRGIELRGISDYLELQLKTMVDAPKTRERNGWTNR